MTTSEQLADFERATVLGFEAPEAERPSRFGQHAGRSRFDPGASLRSSPVEFNNLPDCLAGADCRQNHPAENPVGSFMIFEIERVRKSDDDPTVFSADRYK